MYDRKRIRIAEGRCPDCGCVDPEEGKLRCSDCLRVLRLAARYRRLRYKAEGRCVWCGEPAIPDYVYCPSCRDKNNIRQAAIRSAR